jgi:hypothetical protein
MRAGTGVEVGGEEDAEMKARFRKRGGGGTGAGASNGKGGRGGKIAAGSLAATVVGAIVRDLSRPNSLIRGLVATARTKLLAWRQPPETIDISDTVEVKITDDTTSNADLNNDNRNEQEV